MLIPKLVRHIEDRGGLSHNKFLSKADFERKGLSLYNIPMEREILCSIGLMWVKKFKCESMLIPRYLTLSQVNKIELFKVMHIFGIEVFSFWV